MITHHDLLTARGDQKNAQKKMSIHKKPLAAVAKDFSATSQGQGAHPLALGEPCQGPQTRSLKPFLWGQFRRANTVSGRVLNCGGVRPALSATKVLFVPIHAVNTPRITTFQSSILLGEAEHICQESFEPLIPIFILIECRNENRSKIAKTGCLYPIS